MPHSPHLVQRDSYDSFQNGLSSFVMSITLPFGSGPETCGGIADVCKYSRFVESVRSCSPLNLRKNRSKFPIQLHQVRDVRSHGPPDEHVTQFAHNALDSPIVNVDVGTGQIADRL